MLNLDVVTNLAAAVNLEAEEADDTLVVMQEGTVERAGPRVAVMETLRRQALRPVESSNGASA